MIHPPLKAIVIAATALLFLAGVFFLGALIGPHIIGNKLRAGIKSALVVSSPTDSGYSRWQRNDQPDAVPIYLRFYLFHIKNPDEVLAGTEKPRLVQKGPYTYRKYSTKFNVSFPNDGREVKFKTQDYYVFDPLKSKGSPGDRIRTLNIPYQGVHANVGTGVWYKELTFSLFVSLIEADMFVVKTAHELCFGYQDPMLTFFHQFNPNISPYFGLEVNHTTMEMADRMTEFTTMKTGKSDISELRQYVQWEGKKRLPYWASAEANAIRGTDGTQFHPDVQEDELLFVFVDSAYRTTTLIKTGDSSAYGIPLYRFSLSFSTLLNSTLNPANSAFFQYGPSGVVNISSPLSGFPIFLSKPHFLDADPRYLNGVTGLKPDAKKHDTFVDVEPTTGTVMSAARRLQVNVQIQDTLFFFQDRPEMYVPIGWIEEVSHISEDLASKFQRSVLEAKSSSVIIKYVGIIGGSVLLFASVVGWLSYYFISTKKSNRPIETYLPIEETDDEPSLYSHRPKQTYYGTYYPSQ